MIVVFSFVTTICGGKVFVSKLDNKRLSQLDCTVFTILDIEKQIKLF